MASRSLECLECKQLHAIDQGRETYVKAIQECIDFVTAWQDGYHPLGASKRIAADLKKQFLGEGS